MAEIKARRLSLEINSCPGLYVGACVPFYFCPRSVMLYLLHKGNREGVNYGGGQGPILHLVADLNASIDWAENNDKRWAFTLSNAGSYYFEDRADRAELSEIDWKAVRAHQWSGPGVPSRIKERKQAEFLVEESFPWELIEVVGVHTRETYDLVREVLPVGRDSPRVSIEPDWYY